MRILRWVHLNYLLPGILQKCQPPTAPWRGLLQRRVSLKGPVGLQWRLRQIPMHFAPIRSRAGIFAKHLLNQWSIRVILALGLLAASMTDAIAASPAWVDKMYSICASPNQNMKTVSQQLANEGFVRAKFEDAPSFSNLIAEANILQNFNEESNQVSIKAHVSQNSNMVKSAASMLLASGIPIFWLDDSKLSALVVSRWLFADNRPVSCEIYTNDAAALTQLIEQESDKRLGGGSFDNQFVISHEYFLTGPSSNAIFQIFLETVTENGGREFGAFIGETRAFMRIYQVSS